MGDDVTVPADQMILMIIELADFHTLLPEESRDATFQIFFGAYGVPGSNQIVIRTSDSCCYPEEHIQQESDVFDKEQESS